MLRRRVALLSVLMSGLPLASAAYAGVNVLTWHNDQTRSGANLNEKILMPSNVSSSNFGKLFEIPVDGAVYAQPLIVTNLAIPNNGIHNVVVIATQHDSAYACDADDGTQLWKVSLLKAGESPADPNGCGQIVPEIGITATPVIDLAAGPHGTIYVAAMSKDAQGNRFQRLHALDITNGAEEFGGPVDVVASFPGTGDNSSGGNVVFDPKRYKARAGLVLANGIIYTTWASHCDIRPYTSWVIGYDRATLARVRVLNLTPNGTHGAIWQSGAAPAVDATGNIYALTGDGTFETNLNANGFPNQADFGNCIVKLSDNGNSLGVADYWTMFNTADESEGDADLGSGGAMILPDMRDVDGRTRHLVVGAGKDAHIYIADRDNLGKFDPSSNANLYQDVTGALPSSAFGAPAYYNGKLYYGSRDQALRMFQFNNARLDGTPLFKTATNFVYPGTTPSVSADGATNGIVWANEAANPSVLHAFDARDLTELYNSNQAANNRDHFGAGVKFAVPTVANGKVYLGGADRVGVFALFNPPRLANTSTRANIGQGDNVLIAGLIIQGSAAKPVVLRAIGPSLQLNGSQLQDPVLELHDKNGALIASNDDWGTDINSGQVSQAGLAPSDPHESALARTLSSDTYTAIVSGKGNDTGIGLVELYDLSTAPRSSLSNISSRGFVGRGDDVLIGGVIITGVAPQTVLFRGIGPDLIKSGVSNGLLDPILELHDQNGALIASNDDWRTNQEAEIEATGLAPGNDDDAAILATLQPGPYTAILRGSGDAVGIALIEAYASQ